MAYLNRLHLTQLYTKSSISLYSPLLVLRIITGRRKILNKKMFMFMGIYNTKTGTQFNSTTCPCTKPHTSNVASSEKNSGKLRDVRNVETGRKHMAGNKSVRFGTAI
jgi:hypothetical protein